MWNATFEASLCLFQPFRHWDGSKRSAGAGNNSLGWWLGREGQRKFFPHYNKTNKTQIIRFWIVLERTKMKPKWNLRWKLWKGLGSAVVDVKLNFFGILAGRCGSVVLKRERAGLLLRAGGRGFSPVTMSVNPGYFHRKQKENRTQLTS